MRKRVVIIKRALSNLLIFLLSINSFAAIVSDNDGSAFVTKAEFEALKSSFNSQIKSYNDSIDGKIDGAIASYLSGIKLTTEEVVDNTYEKLNTRMYFGALPLQTTNKKYYVKIAYQMLFQHDGYSDLGGGISTLRLGYKQNSQYSSSGTGVYNTYGEIDGSNYYWYGYVNGEYASSIYNFTGVVMENKAQFVDFTVPTDGVNKSEYTGSKTTSTTYGWGGADEPQLWYKFTPNTGGWSAKNSYWTRGDTYISGTLISSQQYVSGGAVTSTAYDMIDINNRTVDSTSTTGTTTLTTSKNTDSIMTEEAGGALNACLSVGVLYYYPKVKNLNIQNLHNGTTYSKLNRKIKLYEGLPLFTATANGKVSFSFTAKSNDASYPNATFYMRDNTAFENIDTPVGDAKMTVTTGTNTYTDVTDFSLVNNNVYKIEMEVKKDHEYWFKIKPSDSRSCFYVDNFTDIKLKRDN